MMASYVASCLFEDMLHTQLGRQTKGRDTHTELTHPSCFNIFNEWY